MNKRFFALMTILIAIIAVLVGLYSSDIFTIKTDFDTQFISGTIYGDAVLDKNYNKYNNLSVNYKDIANNISYTFIIVKNGTFLMDVFKFSGFQKMESKYYNNVKWDTYFLKTSKPSNIPNNENPTISRSPIFYYNYVCTANQNGADYFILIYSPRVTGSTSSNSDLFNHYVRPMLENIKVKNVYYVPTVQEVFKTTY